MKTEELTNLTSSQLINLVDESRQAAVELGVKWAEANKKFKDLKELMPSFLAEIQLEVKKKGFVESMNEAKLEALSMGSYQEKVKEMNEAEHQTRLLEVEYKAHIKTLEALSAISYVRNNELKLAR